jgi:hypothetical protein
VHALRVEQLVGCGEQSITGAGAGGCFGSHALTITDRSV